MFSPLLYILHLSTRELLWDFGQFLGFLSEQEHCGAGKSILWPCTALQCRWKIISTETSSALTSTCCTQTLNPQMEFACFTNSSYCSAVQWFHSFHSFIQCFSLCDDTVSRTSFQRTSCYYHPHLNLENIKMLHELRGSHLSTNALLVYLVFAVRT